MVTISKVGDSTIKFEFTNNDHYLYNNGEISVPLNSLILVTDDTDLVVFKKIDGDVFVTFLIGNSNFSSKDELVAWYKENMVDGGGSDITSGDVQNMIDESISGKADTSAVTESINAAVSGKVDTTTYNTYTAATDTAIAGKQDTLVSGTNIKTINNESILGSGNITIEGGGGKAINAGTNISVTTGETADTINCTLPITADTDGSVNEILVGNNNTIGSDTNKNIVIGDNNTTFGQGGSRHYSGATIIGYNNNVGNAGRQNDDNDWSTAIGRRNKIGGGNTYIIGVDNNFYDADFYGYKKNYSYVIGRGNTSSLPNDGSNIFVFGAYNKITKSDEFALGKYNSSSNDGTTSGNTFFAIGNGTADNARHNAFEIRQNGDIYLTKDGQDVKLQDQLGSGNNVVELTQAEYDALVSGGTVDPTAFYIITDAVAFDPSTKVDTSAITTSVSSASTDSEIPTAKAVYDMVGNINTILESI